MRPTSLPESFERDEPAHGGSDRSFGLVFTALFLLIGLAPLLHGRGARYWSMNRVWTQFGLLLHKIVNPIVMGLLFFLILTPFAAGLRILGKDPLRRRFDPAAGSYWIPRDPPGPPPRTMTQQF